MILKVKRERWIIFIFLTPALILYSYFLVFPILNSIKLSFYTGTLLSADKFVGFDNYIKLFTQEPFNLRLFGAFWHNIEFFLIILIFQNITALVFAFILVRKFKGSELFRTIYFIPATISVLVVGFLFKLILSPVWGIFDNILRGIGLDFLVRPWLGDPKTALPTIALITSWQYIGIPLILFTAGIKGINEEMIESAKIDGASQLGIAKYIILPLLKPVIGIVIILTFISNFTAFEQIYAMAGSNANPFYSTDIFGSFFYRTTFGQRITANADMGLGAAITSIMFLIILTGVIIWLIASRRKETSNV